MIGPVVAAALWALVASLLLSAVFGAAVAAVIRFVQPAAATRQALWSVALAAAGFAPVIILAAMLIRGASATDMTPAAPAAHVQAAAAPAGNAAIVRSADSGRPAAAARPIRVPEAPHLAPLIAELIVAGWALGALAGLIGLGRSLVRVRGLKLRSSGLDGELATELPWLTETAGREIYLRLSYETETPIAVGFRRPVILIPTEMATAAGLTSIEPLVMHEYAHLARFDDWTNLAQRTIERIFWFNPIVWILGRRVALEREVAADEAVVERTHDAKNYASALWRMAQEMRMPEHVVVAPGAMLTRKQISVRIERLLDEAPRNGRRFGAAALAAGFVALSGVAAVAASAPPIAIGDDAPPPVVAAQAAEPPSPLPVLPKLNPAPSPPPVLGTPAADDQAEWKAFGERLAAEIKRNVVQSQAITIDSHRIVAANRNSSSSKGWISRDVVAACIGCDYSKRDLRGIDLSNMSLLGDDFSGANLEGANLANSSLKGVTFEGAHLAHANFRSAKLTGVDFTHADLTNANFTAAALTGTDLEGATMDGATTTNIHLIGSSLP